MDPMLGMIILWPGTWIPAGWLLCDGSLLEITRYQALYSLLGVTYGGDGQKTFALPDLRSRLPLGTDGRVPDGKGTVGTTSGATTATCNAVGSGSITMNINNLPPHNHAATFTPGSGSMAATSVNVAIPAVSASNASTEIPNTGVVLGKTGGPPVKTYSSAATDTTLKPFTATGSVAIPASSGTVSTAMSGGGLAIPVSVNVPVKVSTLQPALALNFIIAVSGIYPDRS